jgi:hypothetical protein
VWGYAEGFVMATVTLYEELLALFRRFAEHGRNEPNDATVIDIWRKTLGAEDYIILRTLAQLRTTLKRAIDQISSSPILDIEDKELATSAMKALDDLINPNLFHKSYIDIADNVSQRKIVMLSLLSSALKPEFPEPTLAAEDAFKFAKEVGELGEIVRSSNNLSAALKNRLLDYIGYMISTVRNMEMTGVEALYAAFGPPLLFLRQEIAHKEENENDPIEPAKLIYRRMEELFEQIINKVKS